MVTILHFQPQTPYSPRSIKVLMQDADIELSRGMVKRSNIPNIIQAKVEAGSISASYFNYSPIISIPRFSTTRFAVAQYTYNNILLVVH